MDFLLFQIAVLDREPQRQSLLSSLNSNLFKLMGETPNKIIKHMCDLVWFFSFLVMGFSVALGFVCLCVAFFSLAFETDSTSPALCCCLVLRFSSLSPECVAALSGLGLLFLA